MHEEGLDGIADPWPLHLGIKHDLLSHREVGRQIHIDVTEALLVRDHWDRRHLLHSPDQFLPPSGDNQVDVSIQLQKGMHSCPIRDLHDPDGPPGKSRRLR